jgi:hypothetical protein
VADGRSHGEEDRMGSCYEQELADGMVAKGSASSMSRRGEVVGEVCILLGDRRKN